MFSISLRRYTMILFDSVAEQTELFHNLTWWISCTGIVFISKLFFLPWDVRRLLKLMGDLSTLSHVGGHNLLSYSAWAFEVTHDSFLVYSPYLIDPIKSPFEISPELSLSSPFRLS